MTERQQYIAAIGMFDGVHCGHAHLLKQLAQKARELGYKSLALTFSHHPAETICPARAPQLLGDAAQRSRMIKDLGIDRVEVLDFGADDFKLTAAEFIEKIKREYGAQAVLMGFNNHIGSDRKSGDEIKASVPVYVATPYSAFAVSSSLVRSAIADSDFEKARQLLGHEFAVRGTVESGRHLGRTIGFPTANIRPLDRHQLLPPDGVYAVDVVLDNGEEYRAMANIGTRPTVGGHRRTFEVYIIGFDGDLYGRMLEVSFLGRLRNEQKFDSLEALSAQLERDKKAAVAFEK